MNPNLATTALTLSLLFVFWTGNLAAQGQAPQTSNNPNNSEEEASTADGWRGFLSIDYHGGRFVMPYSRIVSISQHDYIVDGGGRVYELTIDTSGAVVARFYFLESMLENNPLKAGQIINNRIKDITSRAEDKSGQDARSVIKHYPQTTHAKMVEFNVSSRSHLSTIFNHVTREWIEEGGKAPGRTLKFQ